MRELIYDVRWQSLRISTLQQYKANGDGGWTTEIGTSRNLDGLLNYVQSRIGETELRMGFSEIEERASRYYRCINMLNATRMGYVGQGLKGSKQDEKVRIVRDIMQVAYSGIKEYSWSAASKWDWSIVYVELNDLLFVNRTMFDNIYENLSNRLVTASKRSSQSKAAQDRSELVTMLDLMERVRDNVR